MFFKCFVGALYSTISMILLMFMLAFLHDRAEKNQSEVSNSKWRIIFFLVCILHVYISCCFLYCLFK